MRNARQQTVCLNWIGVRQSKAGDIHKTYFRHTGNRTYGVAMSSLAELSEFRGRDDGWQGD